MASAAVSLPRARSDRLRPTVMVAALCAGSAALYGWIRMGVGAELHAPFAHWCAEILQPGDWQCGVTVLDFARSYVGGSLFIWLGLAVPGVVLAASGRRVLAVVPVTVAAAGALGAAIAALPGGSAKPFGFPESVFGNIGQSRAFWFEHAEAATFVDVVLVSVPALAVAFLVRPPRRPRPADVPRHAVWASTIAIFAAIAAIRVAWPDVGYGGYLAGPLDDVLVTMTVMFVFGAMLGTDRRWWPWALVPPAVLLSFGPTVAVMSVPSSFTAFTWFADALPLFVVGLVASFWRALATRFARRRTGAPVTTVRSARSAVRPVVAINAAAAGILFASVLAARFDPLGIRIATPLPSFLGARVLAQDVRTKTNLADAVVAMEAHRSVHGSYAGFDAANGEELAPALVWTDERTGEELVVRVTSVDATRAQVVARSPSGTTFCAETFGGGATFGAGDTIVAARAACGSAPFTADSLRMLPVETFCDDVDDDALLLCRHVQRLMRETLAAPIAQ